MSNQTQLPQIVRARIQRYLSRTIIMEHVFAVMAVSLALAASPAHAANVIQNPGFEANSGYGYFGGGTIPSIPGNWMWGSLGYGGWWMQAAGSGANNPHSGNNFFKEWGAYKSFATTNVFYQDNACAAGATFTCDFWQGSTSNAFNSNPDRYGFAYVSFLGTSNDVLALYSAPLYNSNYVGGVWTSNINWFHFFVTNQNDVVSGAVTGSVTELVAPTGAHTVRFTWGNWQSASFDGGDFGLDDVNLDQTGGPVAPQITQVYPGDMLFASNHISFHVTSATSTPIDTNDIHLVVDDVDVSSGCSFSGSSPDITVTYAGVVDNAWGHTASITAVDTLGLAAPPQSFSFDTIHPAIVVEFEDYDYTNAVSGGGGLYINNPVPSSTPQTNSYFGLQGALDTDYSTGGNYSTAYRPLDKRNINHTGDAARQIYLDAQVSDPDASDWEIDNIGTGDWGNYTRDYPAGTYNVYARVSGNAGTQTKLSLDNVAGGIINSNVGVFDFTGQGWGVWQYASLQDEYGNLLPLSFGGTQTLRATLTPVGGLNENFFFLVPAVAGQPFFNSISPLNGEMFATNTAFSFTVSSPVTINAGGIQIFLNGLDVTADPSTSITGGTTATASCALLQPNTVYTAFVTVTNMNGAGTTRTIKFDTMNPNNFYVKMLDWDFDGGMYDAVNNGLVAYAYQGLNAVTNVDYYLGSALNSPFRGPNGLHQENCLDTPFGGWQAGNDYDIGNFNSGQWANYTRDYPAGSYYIFARLASGGNGSVTLSQVTAGQGTTNQTTAVLGTASASTKGWQTWGWSLLQNNGTPAIVNVGGVNTLRATSGGGLNANYFMFVPVPGINISAALLGGDAVISFPTVTGSSYRVLYRTSLTSGSWTVLTTVTGDGTVMSVNDPAAGNERFYQVVSP